jgi:uncharacterized membrane protein
MPKKQELAQELLKTNFESLTEHEKRVLMRIIEGRHISRNVNEDFEERLTLGQKVADKVAVFGGSWPFIFIFASVIFVWVLFNSVTLLSAQTFDPYPYILLNLLLSMLAAIQAPVIMMSQNRQAAKDRMNAAFDYEVNLKAELEILGLHQKLNQLTAQHEKMLRIITDFTTRHD